MLDCGATKYTITDAWLRAVQLPEFSEVLKVPQPTVSGSSQHHCVVVVSMNRLPDWPLCCSDVRHCSTCGPDCGGNQDLTMVVCAEHHLQICGFPERPYLQGLCISHRP